MGILHFGQLDLGHALEQTAGLLLDIEFPQAGTTVVVADGQVGTRSGRGRRLDLQYVDQEAGQLVTVLGQRLCPSLPLRFIRQ